MSHVDATATMSQSTKKDEETIPSDDSTSSSAYEEGWGFLLGGLSTEMMASTDWATSEDENFHKKDRTKHGVGEDDVLRRSSADDNTVFGKNQHKSQFDKDDQANRNDTDNLKIDDYDVQEQLQQQQTISQRAFSISPNGQILKPPVRILDRSSEKKGNVLIATKHIPKGSVIFTEKALEGIQVPSSSSLATRGNLYKVRACQNCFRSLEPASCISSEDFPLSELWPVSEYDDGLTSESQQRILVADSDEEHSGMLFLHTKSGRTTCRNCGAVFCNRYCAKHHLETIGDCCRCTKAIEGLVNVVVCSEKERLFSINGDSDNDDDDDNDEGKDFASLVDIDPVLVLATKMFITKVRRYRSDDDTRDRSEHDSASDCLFYGLCGDAEDIHALGFEASSAIPNNDADNAENNTPPLLLEYEVIANAIELTEAERSSDSQFSLRQFHKIVAIAQRNAISLTTGSPFRTYYQSMIRQTGGRGSSRQQKVASDVARLLGSKDGKLTRDMDRIVETKVSSVYIALQCCVA